jgi:Flp pilus assembly protein TadD
MRLATSFAAIAFLVVGLCLASPMTPAASRWTGQATAHFALFTSQDAASRQDLLERLERTRLFFEKMGWPAHDLKRPLRILAFSSEKEFEAYAPIPAAFAFYQRTREGDFVLMRPLEPENYPAVMHEYTHFIVEHSGLQLPLWLNEGLADFYSTLDSREGQVAVGTPPRGREETLRCNEWMDWQQLTGVDHSSPYYQELNKMLLFYSQSWALVHVLALDTDYESKLHGFLTAVSANSPAEDPWSATYHRSLREVGSQAQQEFTGNKLKPRLFDLDIRPGALQSAEAADATEQTEFALAAVLAANPKRLGEAKVRFEILAAKYPDDPRPAESLGVMSWGAGQKGEAEREFELAVKKHSHDPEILFLLAHLKLARNSTDEAIDLLQQALAVNPEYYNALVELGFAAAKSQNFQLAAATLEKIAQARPEHAFQVAYTLAYALSELNQTNRARGVAEQSWKLASNAHDKQQATELLAYIQHEAKEEGATQ